MVLTEALQLLEKRLAIPKTERDDNLSPEQIELREAWNEVQAYIEYLEAQSPDWKV